MPKKKKDNPFQWLARKAHELLEGESAYISKEKAKEIREHTIKGGLATPQQKAEMKAKIKAKTKTKPKTKPKKTAAELLVDYARRTGSPGSKK